MDFWGKMLNAAGTALNVDAKDLTDLGNEQVDLNQGAVIVSHPLDFDQSPGNSVGGSPSLGRSKRRFFSPG